MGYVNAIDKVDSNIELSAFALSFNNTGSSLEAGVTGGAAPINFGKWIHALVNF